MKISLDLDGTALERPALFAVLSRLFISEGHEVGILTGHKTESEAHDRKKLSALGFPEMSFYFGRTTEFMPLNGAHFKAKIINEQGIDLHFDDCDYNHPDTLRLFKSLGIEEKIAKLTSIDKRFEGLK